MSPFSPNLDFSLAKRRGGERRPHIPLPRYASARGDFAGAVGFEIMVALERLFEVWD